MAFGCPLEVGVGCQKEGALGRQMEEVVGFHLGSCLESLMGVVVVASCSFKVRLK